MSKATNKKLKAPTVPELVVVESYDAPDAYTMGRFRNTRPSCFNGAVQVRRYRYTAELIDEPVEVIQARLLRLWRNCDNHHHYGPLQREAKKYDFELPSDEFGKDRKR